MTSFWRIFCLELKAALRTGTLPVQLALAAAWMAAAPFLVRGDGTVEGAREMLVGYSLGGVLLLTVVSSVACATGSLARERAARRLQLTLVRPVRHWSVALAKTAALALSGALVLALGCAWLAIGSGASRPCRHVLKPVLPTPREEAETLYAAYMADPETPEPIRKAGRSTVIGILMQRARDRYQTIGTNETVRWRFDLPGEVPCDADAPSASVRLRFTNSFDMRRDVRGHLRLGGAEGTLDNITQAVVEVPLVRAASGGGSPGELVFANHGDESLMLRPRMDVDLMLPGDAFGWNLLRGYGLMVALVLVTVSFGVFLGAGLGRPVALFVAMVALAVGEMGPSVVDRCPEEIGSERSERIGLAITRVASAITHPVSALSPLEPLSRDECVEPAAVGRALLWGGLAVPLLFAFLSGLVLPRKPDAPE